MQECGAEIDSIENPGVADCLKELLSTGDAIVEMNGDIIRDQIDFHFLMPERGTCRLKVKSISGAIKEVDLDAEKIRASGIRFAPLRFKRCRNKCIFCFVDQMPQGLRQSLYFKDEDYRLGFLFGNYTTLNDIYDAEIERIIEQQLGPQYVSVHAVNEDLREKIFGRPMKRRILDTLKLLAEGGIEIHAQIVLCPEINDGKYLDQSINALAHLHKNVRSLSVVPVGLMRYRDGSSQLNRYRHEEYPYIIKTIENYQKEFMRSRRKSRFVFLSDEWYLGSGVVLPQYEEYEEFDQIDNGVGITRNFLNEIAKDIEQFGLPHDLDRVIIVTGVLGSRVIRDYIFPIFKTHGLKTYPEVLEVKNNFFGEEVTVSGLLVYDDILSSLQNRLLRSGRTSIFIPPNTVNYKGRFLDGPTPQDLENALGRKVSIPESSLIKELYAACAPGGLDE